MNKHQSLLKNTNKLKNIQDRLNICKNNFNKTTTLYNKLNYHKGKNCSVSGNSYEKSIYTILKNNNFIVDDKIGGSSNNKDITITINNKIIGIEVKKCTSPDYGQISIEYNEKSGNWIPKVNSKLPDKAIKLFTNLLQKKELFNGKIPPFVNRNITHVDWLKEKKQTKNWNDIKFDINDNSINEYYLAKDNKYIQISSKGLYYLEDNDELSLDIPKFSVDTHLRIRTKIHKRSNSKGFCNMSITASLMPKKIKNLEPSKYSLDSVTKLPPALIKLLCD